MPRGAGTLGSRSLQTAGNAVLAASKEVLVRAQQIAAHLLEASPDDILARRRRDCTSPVCPASTVSWGELAAVSRDAGPLPDGLEPGPLRHEGDFDGRTPRFPSAPMSRWSRSTPRPAR